MSQPKFNVPLAIIKDRYIFALGGCLNNMNLTNSVEMFDIVNNKWYPVSSMTNPRSMTTATVVNNRWIYIMPGNSPN